MNEELIKEHYSAPKNNYKIEKSDKSAVYSNPMCGDEITIFVKQNPTNQTVFEISFMGSGCSICIAAASLITEICGGIKLNADALDSMEKTIREKLDIPTDSKRYSCMCVAVNALKNCL